MRTVSIRPSVPSCSATGRGDGSMSILKGTSGADVLSGEALYDIISGLDGNDVLVDGLAGSAVPDVSVSELFAGALASVNPLASFASMMGDQFNPQIFLLAMPDAARIWGGNGNDILVSTEGGDKLYGNGGTDTAIVLRMADQFDY